MKQIVKLPALLVMSSIGGKGIKRSVEFLKEFKCTVGLRLVIGTIF